jgi:hypothetical protein
LALEGRYISKQRKIIIIYITFALHNRYNMVTEKKLETPKRFSSIQTGYDEIKATTRWQCEVSACYLFKVIIFEADLESGVGHKTISYSA